MGNVVVGDILRVVAEWNIPDGSVAQLVWHLEAVSGSTVTDLVVGAQAIVELTAAWAIMEDYIADVVTGGTLEMYLRDTVLHRWDGVYANNIAALDGLDAAEMIGHGTSALVKMFTSKARRQGRKYIMGLTESDQADGTLVGLVLTAAALFMARLDDDFSAGALNLEVGTYNTDVESPLYETFSAASQGVQAEGILAYQRRRRPGTGI